MHRQPVTTCRDRATLCRQGALMPHHTISQPSSPNGASDLRRRKRIRTKQMVQKEALRLFADKGYDQTTVDDIAHAAAMSPRTFFRYFPSKEDVVLWDEYDERPMRELLRIKLGFAVPEIRARFLNSQLELLGPQFQQIANAIGTEGDDLQLAVTLAALYSAMLVAVERWQRHDGREDLLRMCYDAVAALAARSMDLRDTAQAARAGTRPRKPRAVAAKRKP